MNSLARLVRFKLVGRLLRQDAPAFLLTSRIASRIVTVMVFRGPTYTLACWLWLTVFSLMSLFSGAFVVCTDSFGSRLELGCAKTDTGECVYTRSTATAQTSANFVHVLGTQKPCLETPVTFNLIVAPTSSSFANVDIQLPPPLLVATLISLTSQAEVTQSKTQPDEQQRPPDVVEMLGSIILLV